MSRCNLCGKRTQFLNLFERKIFLEIKKKSEYERNMQDQGLCNSCDDLYTEEELMEMIDNGK
jgi:hypothetical protein